MNWRIIRALVAKDLALFFRNRFFAIITVLGLVIYLLLYFLVLPSSVDESLKIGLYTPVTLPVFEQATEEGLEVQIVESEDALKEGVIEGDYIAGIALPADILDSIASGQKPKINVYFTSYTAEEIKVAVEVLIKELVYQQVGQPLPIEVSGEVLGPDMLGMQIPPRDRMRPMLAVMLIIFETFGLANLISQEIERGTINALLVTPVSVKDLFTAKGIAGVTLAFGQGILFLTIAGGLNKQPLIVLLALLLGAILVTGIGFIIASLGKDFMSVLAWGMVALIPLFIPSFGVMFPGTVTGWVKMIPSYYLVDTIHQAANFGAGWGDVWSDLLILTGFDVVLLWIGVMALRRKSR